MQPGTLADQLAYMATRCIHNSLDFASGFSASSLLGQSREFLWLRRLLLLETAAVAPGLFSGIALERLPPLRRLRQDRVWLKEMLWDARQGQMHLSVFSDLCKHNRLSRLALASQKVCAWSFGLVYLAWPRFGRWCVEHSHEAVVQAYTELLEELDAGRLPRLAELKVSEEALSHYGLAQGATLREVVEKIRQDQMLAR